MCWTLSDEARAKIVTGCVRGLTRPAEEIAKQEAETIRRLRRAFPGARFPSDAALSLGA